MPRHSALCCVSGIRQDNAKPLISNGLRFVVTCLLTAALWVLFHSFRHARATHWLEDGVNLAQIQKLLGHESIETTMKYVGVSSEQMVQALCSMEDNLTLDVEKKYKKIRNKDSLATVLGLR